VPVIGAVMCFWLMLNLPHETWIAFGVWMSVGLVIYFTYSYSHSALERATQNA
jgi:APA family basic amino acid/polyamine antiporter